MTPTLRQSQITASIPRQGVVFMEDFAIYTIAWNFNQLTKKIFYTSIPHLAVMQEIRNNTAAKLYRTMKVEVFHLLTYFLIRHSHSIKPYISTNAPRFQGQPFLTDGHHVSYFSSPYVTNISINWPS